MCIVRIECLNNSSFTMRRCNRFYPEPSKKPGEKWEKARKYWKSVEVYRGIVSFFFIKEKKTFLKVNLLLYAYVSAQYQ